MNCSTPGFPIHHQLSKLAQTHVHQVGDAIQPSHPVIPFSSCLQSFPASGSFLRSQFYHIRWPKYYSFSFSISPSNEYSGLISFRIDWFDLVQGTLKSLLQHQQFKSINSSVLSFLYSPTLTSRHAAAAKSCQSCPTLYDPTDGTPPGSAIPGILQARILEWVGISFSHA